MLIEFAQELNQILTEVETLTRENEELKAEICPSNKTNWIKQIIK